MIDISQQLTVRGRDIHALGRLSEIFARPLPRDLSVEVALGIFLASLIPLIDRDRHKLFREGLYQIFVTENRHTVDHAIVSGAAKRMTIHRPDEHWLLRTGC